MTRTKIKERVLPDYTKGEEIMNMVTHIIGAVFGIACLVLCVVKSAFSGDPYLIVGNSIYGATLVILYTNSSVYHGLNRNTGKKVMQIIDHCSIYFLIAGTYTPILLGALRRINPVVGWTMFGIVWGLCILGTTFSAIDLKNFQVFENIIYLLVGWSIVFVANVAIKALTKEGFTYLLLGGVSYTIGAILYGLGVKHRYMHSVFHIFVLIGSFLQFITIYYFVL